MSAQIIESWIDQYSDELLHWAEYRTGDSALAQDMVQETFIAAFENYHQFKGDSNPKTWLSRILRNKIVDYFRSAYYRKNIFEGQASDDDGPERSHFDTEEHWRTEIFQSGWEEDETLMDQEEFRSLFEQCLNALPQAWRDIIAAKYFAQEKGQDISQEFNISTSNYWQIIHRAKLSLKKCLEVYWKSWSFYNLSY